MSGLPGIRNPLARAIINFGYWVENLSRARRGQHPIQCPHDTGNRADRLQLTVNGVAYVGTPPFEGRLGGSPVEVRAIHSVRETRRLIMDEARGKRR